MRFKNAEYLVNRNVNGRISSFASLMLAGCLLMFAGCSGTENASDETSNISNADKSAEESTIGEENSMSDTLQMDYARAGYIIVTDTIKNDGKEDVAEAIQELIDDNPNRTIYFPDGVYRISKPIRTPADPSKSVDLQLSNYAIIRAANDWDSSSAMICLGAKNPANDISTPGSCYSLTGGIVDGSGKAAGISIDGGRETAIKDVSIKNTTIGIRIKKGANSGSSDADISDVNIVGAGGDDSIGVLVEGYDNTFTNMRIANVCIGVKLMSSGNMLRNIHPLYYLNSCDYEKSYGFYDESGNNWYDICYSDQFRCGFYIADDLSNVYDNCFCYWYSGAGEKQTAFRAGGKFNSLITSVRAGFHNDSKANAILEVGEQGGEGVIEYVLTNSGMITNNSYKKYLSGRVIG